MSTTNFKIFTRKPDFMVCDRVAYRPHQMPDRSLEISDIVIVWYRIIVVFSNCANALADPRLRRWHMQNIMITCPCNEHPLTPHFYIVKMDLPGYTFFPYFCSKT